MYKIYRYVNGHRTLSPSTPAVPNYRCSKGL